MDSPQSGDERLQQAGAGEAMLSKKMKLLIIMLSLVLIISLLPVASNHGLPLLKPMGFSMLQRLWDAMRFIAMTAALSVGIISTSSQKHDKGFDRSAHLRSASNMPRSSTPIASSSRESINMITNLDMNTSGSPDFSVGRDVNEIFRQESRGKEMGNLQKSKGKEVMDDYCTSASSSNAFCASREEEIDGLQSPSKYVHSRRAPSQEENYENLKPRPMNSRRRLSASDMWFLASRIDEEIEEECNIASASQGFSPGKSVRDGRVESQKKSSPMDEKESMSNKEIKSADRGFMNVYARMTDDNYAELRMRKAAISRLADETLDANGKGHRRSSSVDRRRPIHYDDQGPDRPGLKQILVDVSKERAFKGKLSNLSPANKNSLNAHRKTNDATSVQASISSVPNITSTSLIPQSMKANVRHYPSTETLPSDQIAKYSDADSMGSNQAGHRHKQQEVIKMGSNQILRKQADNAKMGPNEMVQSKQTGEIKLGINQTPSQIRQKQVDAIKGSNQRIQADQAKMHSNQIVQRQNDYQIKQKPDDYQAKVGINQSLQKQADAKMAFAQTLQRTDASVGSDMVSQRQLRGDAKAGSDVSEGLQIQHQSNDTKETARIVQSGDRENQDHLQSSLMHKASMSSRSKLLSQSSKHSRSALNLEQLEQTGNTDLHARPPAGSSAKRKKSFSCDFGDGFSPDWLWELEPPPPPGFIDQQNVITTPTKAKSSSLSYKAQPDLENDSATTLVQSLVPWRSSNPIDISAYPRATSPASPPDIFSHATGPSPGEVNRRADEFISNFTTKLIKQRQESLERQRRYG